MNEELPQLINDLRAVAADARTSFGTLTPAQLNWKPSPTEWSVAQCLDHLITSNSGYLPLIKSVISSEHKTSLKERLPLLPRFFGPMVLKVVQPQSQRKLKAGRNFQPSSSAIDPDIILRFASQQNELADQMKLSDKLDLRKIIITSPVASFVTYSLLDGYRIIVAHDQRHVAQAKRVTNRDSFPTS